MILLLHMASKRHSLTSTIKQLIRQKAKQKEALCLTNAELIALSEQFAVKLDAVQAAVSREATAYASLETRATELNAKIFNPNNQIGCVQEQDALALVTSLLQLSKQIIEPVLEMHIDKETGLLLSANDKLREISKRKEVELTNRAYYKFDRDGERYLSGEMEEKIVKDTSSAADGLAFLKHAVETLNTCTHIIDRHKEKVPNKTEFELVHLTWDATAKEVTKLDEFPPPPPIQMYDSNMPIAIID